TGTDETTLAPTLAPASDQGSQLEARRGKRAKKGSRRGLVVSGDPDKRKGSRSFPDREPLDRAERIRTSDLLNPLQAGPPAKVWKVLQFQLFRFSTLSTSYTFSLQMTGFLCELCNPTLSAVDAAPRSYLPHRIGPLWLLHSFRFGRCVAWPATSCNGPRRAILHARPTPRGRARPARSSGSSCPSSARPGSPPWPASRRKSSSRSCSSASPACR